MVPHWGRGDYREVKIQGDIGYPPSNRETTPMQPSYYTVYSYKQYNKIIVYWYLLILAPIGSVIVVIVFSRL